MSGPHSPSSMSAALRRENERVGSGHKKGRVVEGRVHRDDEVRG